MNNTEIKRYYINGEKYDWTTEPKRFERLFHNKREEEIVRLIEKHSKNTRVLDVGCGTGFITRHLMGDVIGLDINRWNLDRAKNNSPDTEFILGDIENLPIRDLMVDTVVCTETLEHLPDSKRAVNEVFRVLNSKGKFIGSVPSNSIIWRFRKWFLTTCPVSEPFHNNYTKRHVKLLLKRFKLIRVFSGAFGLIIMFVVRKR
jgi:ubiquinone/menaquinone biosynthesis C-methylase UbiE